jgi:sigma-B regulation protein RsbU (phosphoserine phosphatase)
MDGFAVLAALRENGRSNDLPIIVISAMSEIEAVVRCVELGAEDFLFKPFNPTLLRARVLATLEKKALRDAMRDELKRKQAELNEARTLQLALTPPAFEGRLAGHSLSIEVVLEPAKEVGGDLVDYFFIADDLLVMLLGDVSDKGAGAALMMARTHSTFRSLASRPDARELFSEPAKAAGIVNDALAIGNDSCMFVTLLLATFDIQKRQLTYVRAGHIPPFHRKLAHAGGPPLGVMKGTVYQQGETGLSSGDRLLIVTDGVTEASSPDGQLFGEDRIEAFLAGGDTRDVQGLRQLVEQVRAFEADCPPFDDVAALLLSIDPP